jgi:CRISPR/Cas system CSM-associated protein Csm4 (group 5 of RAMP superfamily)
LLYEEASECFEECIVRMNSSSITPAKDQDVDYKVLQFLCRFFKICCQLKKTKSRSIKKKWNEEVKQLEESQEIKNKDVQKIFTQLTGFAKFLKLKADLLHKLKKLMSSQMKNKGMLQKDNRLGLSKLGDNERKELISCLNDCFVKSECINTFILSGEVLKSFLEFITTAHDPKTPKPQNPVVLLSY